MRLNVIVPIIIAVVGISILTLTYPINLSQQDQDFTDPPSKVATTEMPKGGNTEMPEKTTTEMPKGGNIEMPEKTTTGMPKGSDTDMDEITYAENLISKFNGNGSIKKISSEEELRDILTAYIILDEINDAAKVSIFQNEGLIAREGFIASNTLEESLNLATTRNYAGVSSPYNPSYSGTNIQVENVDEPDYLKNDAKYVYIVSGNTLSIIDAYPAEYAKIIVKISLDVESKDIRNMFLNGDRLVIFYEERVENKRIPQYNFIPENVYNLATHAMILDVSDKKNPEIIRDYFIHGQFKDARMIGDYVYFVTNSEADDDNPRFPEIVDDSGRITIPDTYYFDNSIALSTFNTITAIDIFGDTINSETYLLGPSGTFYVSKDSFYLTYPNDNLFWTHEKHVQDRFFDVVVPLLPKAVQDGINKIQNDRTTAPVSKWAEISRLMQESYNGMNSNDREELFAIINNALHKHDSKLQADTVETIIHKISIDKNRLEYIAKGSVPGTLLNQFSMDQNGKKLRVATTTETYAHNTGTVRANAVYVLDKELEIVGELENIAVNERIFSARFIDDRLYLVTFVQVDPFFVIDLSGDNPKILGELKIPGFSDYLHPYNEDYIIGVGRDATGTGQQRGVKIALFDVRDVSNPIVTDDIIIGDPTTHSKALDDHKAFFFDQERKIISIPISGQAGSLSGLSSSKSYNDVWNGFYVFDIDDTFGFDLRGIVPHMGNINNYDTDHARTFYIKDVLYTATDMYLKLNSIDNMNNINTIELMNTGAIIKHLE